ncbi:conserved hypothetical protein [Crocosphaera subtropica ATCC 51142]|uniref:DUF2157 domain-containing protein n=1 Tax=Crocosphaera subtropica (strain ATCC 51142 / BH68) TaxID=43989 RepID=B1WX23_CROS5|nr:hypothetical protein [Crocosphaera subtropica]ACB52492.1 conserved hypothetical protein [Crocosphaera subtropica ATCC 51142]
MSSPREHSISIQITQKTAISELLEGWQYWLDLGLISEQRVPARLISSNDSFQVNFKTTLSISNLIKQLQVLQEVDCISDETLFNLTVKIEATNPCILQGLDRWLQLGLLNHEQVKNIAQKELTCAVRTVPLQTVPPTKQFLIPSLSASKSKVSTVGNQRRNTPSIPQIIQSLMAELSVIWLLLLGVFMVVVSSGVIAANWWQTFPAVLQYGILWLYTLGFGVASWWTGKQANLRLTTQALRIVTLLLVPINFLAMDTFPLWHTFLGLIGMLIGSLSLTILTIKLFKDNSQSSSHSLPLLNHLGLTYLHWGWTLPGIPLIATYVGVIATTIITLISPKNTEINNKRFLPFSLTEAIIIYALMILLVRAIFIAEVNIFQLGLAISLCGWLMGWRSPPKTPWKWLGSGTLTLGWLLSVFVIPSQAIAISLLAITWLGKHFKISGSRRDFILIFLIGLQVHWLMVRLPILQTVWTNIIDLTNTNSHPFVLSSVGLFPFLFFIVLGRHFFIDQDQVKLYNFSSQLAFLFGIILTAISLINPLVRTVNLMLSSLTLAYETKYQLKHNRHFFIKPLALLTHIGVLLTVISAINYYFPDLSINLWSLIVLGLMMAEIVISLITFSEESLLKLINYNTWNIGLVLATISYGLLWFQLPVNSSFWGLNWLLVPCLLTAIAIWYVPRRKLASELSVIAICLTQALTVYFPETRLIGLVIGTILMIINTRYLRHLYSVIITVGLGLTSIFFYLYILNLSASLWILSGVIITLLLWFVRHVLSDNTSELGFIYAQTFDGYAYILSLITLIRLFDISLVYTSTTNVLISSVILMGSVTYRSWQPTTEENKLSLWYSILVLAVVPLPALSLPSWGWIELGIATILMVVQTQIFKQVSIGFITIGFFLELIVVILEDNGLKYGEQFWLYWSLLASVTATIFWILYHLLNYYQRNSIDYYKKALDLWGITLCTVNIIFLTVFRLSTDYLLNNDLILLITLNLIMISMAYRSWQNPRQNVFLWSSVIVILIVQFLNPNPLPTRIITSTTGTTLLFIHSYFLPYFFTALITVGMIIFCRSLILLKVIEVFDLSIIPIWIVSDSITLMTLWLVWSYLKEKPQSLAKVYRKVVDVWGMIICGLILTTLTLHSVAIYWDYMNPSITVIVAICILFLGILYRTKKQPNNLMFYTLGWTLELLTINITTKLSQSLILLAFINIVLGILFQVIGEWWQKRTGETQYLSSLHILPLLYGALGTALRWNFFNHFTGLISLGLALIIIGVGRRKEKFKPLIYLALVIISYSAYELLFYQISPLPWGDKCLSMAALATGIMYCYRLASPWLSSYLYLTTRELKIVAHLHWIFGSICLGFSLLYPVQSQQLIGLGAGLFLTQYAILEGRNFLDKRQGEIWVYLGFIEGGGTTIYGFLSFPSVLLSNVIGSILSLLSIVIYTLPWRQWGWSKRPWNLLAFTLPLLGVISSFNSITLLVASIGYGILSKLSNRPRLFYPSLLLINVAIYNNISAVDRLSLLLYSSLLCLSLLSIIVFEPYCQREEGKSVRHSLRLIATGIVGMVSLLFYRETGIIPGVLGFILIIIGLGFKTRGFLFNGTITFLITVFYQLVIVSFSYPLLKWIIGLLLGLTFIWIAANFENRRTQISTLINHWMQEFETWD